MKRYLAHKVYSASGVSSLAVVTVDSDKRPTVSPFSGETESTAFVQGSIFLLSPDAKPEEIRNLADIDARSWWADDGGEALLAYDTAVVGDRLTPLSLRVI